MKAMAGCASLADSPCTKPRTSCTISPKAASTCDVVVLVLVLVLVVMVMIMVMIIVMVAMVVAIGGGDDDGN